MEKKQAILSLGSNLGNRLELLQKALILLENASLNLTALSSIYETPAWGFESTPFYNACAQIETSLSPQELLSHFLQVEAQLGRIRQQTEGYTARKLDIDLLFYDGLVVATDTLTLPHPKLHIRNFVLVPLQEIAPQWEHPILNLPVTELLLQCPDPDQIEKLPYATWSPPIFDAFPFIAIEGNIGVGKTTLAQKMAAHYNLPLVEEAYAQNPYLEKFYTDPKKHALAVETYFLEDRLQQAKIFWEGNPAAAISDFTLQKSLIFAAQNLTETDYQAYHKRFAQKLARQKLPDLVVYLHTDIDTLQRQIKQRGRPYEENITRTYLEQIAQGYSDYIQSDLPYPVVSISTQALDFKANDFDFHRLLRLIYRASFS